ncbi:MAG: hypothetical protein JO295_04555, partial [Verrucomicrobia bacterium]|nr:hypothetical protein [Verrucomicrobiota bacterium]
MKEEQGVTSQPENEWYKTSITMRHLITLGFTLSLILLMNANAFARAGGGGGGAGAVVGGGIFIAIVTIIVLPFYIAWMLIRKAKQKVEDTVHSHQLHKAAKHDPFWDEDALKARVEKVFFTVQRAWMARDQEIAREFITQRLYDKHKLQTDIMIEQHEKNMLQNMNLIEVQVVKVEDQAEDTKDKLWTRIRGS